jgi:hypothetical protein
MMMRNIVVALTIGCLAIGSVHATDGADAGNADAALNTTYKALLSKLDGGNQQRLREAQRAWIGFRDKECNFRAQGGEGGSSSASTRSDCIAELTRQRTDALEHQLDCPEGDVSCVPRNRADSVAVDVPCLKSMGNAKSAVLVQRCIQVSPATHPPCNAANSCDLILDEIRRGCAMIGKDAPAFCTDH